MRSTLAFCDRGRQLDFHHAHGLFAGGKLGGAQLSVNDRQGCLTVRLQPLCLRFAQL